MIHAIKVFTQYATLQPFLKPFRGKKLPLHNSDTVHLEPVDQPTESTTTVTMINFNQVAVYVYDDKEFEQKDHCGIEDRFCIDSATSSEIRRLQRVLSVRFLFHGVSSPLTVSRNATCRGHDGCKVVPCRFYGWLLTELAI